MFVFVAAVAVRLLFYALTAFTADDAFITFRYAANIASGNGFVYNLGERVLGTTTPLFTLILSFFALADLPLPQSALIISLIASGLTAVVMYRFALLLRFTHFALLPPVLYILWPRSVAVDGCGMETALFTLLVTAAFYFQHQAKPYYAVGMATLASVTRPEGFLALGILLIMQAVKNSASLVRLLLLPATILIPWFSFAYWYFGSIVPHSMTAKLALYSHAGTLDTWNRFVYLLGWHNPVGIALFIAAIPGWYWLRKKQGIGVWAPAWLLGFICFLGSTPTRLFPWYVVPVYPIYLLLASATGCFIAERLEMNAASIQKSMRYVTILILLPLGVGVYQQVRHYREFQEVLETVHKEIGLYLYRNAAQNDIVAAEDIGYVGYYSGLRILDRDGLVSPESVPYNRVGEYGNLIYDRHPDWVVAAEGSPISGFVADSLFRSMYRHEQRFERHAIAYSIYARVR